ncbi:MAG: hypothetical protein HY744_31815 [Deltaproteobacteria bacterium]|nr:hypothetical protein [Deltaproteobacteria bacterium]
MSSRARLVLPLAGCVVVLALAAVGACSGSDAAGSGAASAGGAATSTGSTWTISGSGSSASASGCGSGGSACSPQPIPPQVPEGWVEYTDWSCDCRFYVPCSKQYLPKPIEWVPCPPEEVGSIDCRMMKTDWTSPENPTPVDLEPRLGRDEKGTPLLLFRRVADDYLMDLVAELDGPVRTAIVDAGPKISDTDPGCFLAGGEVDEGRFVFGVRGHDANGKESESPHTGAIGGYVDDLSPPVLAHWTSGADDYVWFANAAWVLRASMSGDYVSPWTMDQDILVHNGMIDPEGMIASQYALSGTAVFVGNASLKRDNINVWTPERGLEPFVRFFGDYTRGAADLGTDGKVLVWNYGEGKEPDDWVYPIASIMTAPYTTKPEELQPRRVRSLPDDRIGNFELKVGCGYVTWTGWAFVVRLSDGWMWEVPDKLPKPYFRPLGVTCTELIARERRWRRARRPHQHRAHQDRLAWPRDPAGLKRRGPS